MRLADTHQHAWDLRRFPYTWCSAIAALNRSFMMDDYAAAAAGLGIEKTVFMESDVDEPHALDEARYVQELASAQAPGPAAPRIRGIVASCRPERGGFEAHLKEALRLPLLRGFRRILHTQPDSLSQTPLFSANLNLLPAHGMTFDLCVLARQLPVAAALVRRCPAVTFILDHCGVPDIRAGALDPWREHLRILADLPNVNCKVSGIIAYADPATWNTATLRPWFEWVIGCFGWDRVVWGGDWPVCTQSASLRRWVEATGELCAGASEGERDRLFHRNAERIYRI